ncbi:hypothetical protein [Geothrix terrae]|uniref:hypothetical protein n=1 Tax=Geothrix terrae TaxID=2922720 RepID=UPI001FADCC7D|nr:hypothetical protein [Geothrix terrae]
MTRILAFLLTGLLLIAAVIGVFFKFEYLGKPALSDGQYWALFGTYFGGVVGPLLTFLSVLLIVYTINQQSKQIASADHETLKRDLLAHITKADDEIDRWLQRQLPMPRPSGLTVEFGDIVWGLAKSDCASLPEFRTAIARLHYLTSLYCEALGLYRDNINPHFIFTYHRKKAESLLAFLMKHSDHLDPMSGPSLAFCQMNLDSQRKA